MKRVLIALALSCCIVGAAAAGENQQVFKSDPLAAKFAQTPTVSGLHLSPDGTKISLIDLRDSDVSAALVLDMRTGKASAVLAGKKGATGVDWCDWATNDRLLCGAKSGFALPNIGVIPINKLIAVNADGSGRQELASRELPGHREYQDQIVSWIPDDPSHILFEVSGAWRYKPDATALLSVDIETGQSDVAVKPIKHATEWLADGRGRPRAYSEVVKGRRNWFFRNSANDEWRTLHKPKEDDSDDDFWPMGFASDENVLYYLDDNQGHLAVWSRDLTSTAPPHVVYAEPDRDITSYLTLGKSKQLVAVGYPAAVMHQHFLDAKLAELDREMQKLFPGKTVTYLDRSRDERYTLLAVMSPTTPADYYRHDRKTHKLEKIGTSYPALASTTIANVKPMRLFARDGHFIPAFLSLPVGRVTKKLPLVINPNGGELLGRPLGFDPMTAFLAASGYAVLQIGPYARTEKNGRAGWQQLVDDIADGANYLVEIGVADPARICIGGSDIKGYLALMSTVRYPGLYKCVYSINGTTDLKELIQGYKGSTRREVRKIFGGGDDKSLKTASPIRRAADIKVPLLMFQSGFSPRARKAATKKMIKALDRANDRYDVVEYDVAIDAALTVAQRTDMFSRLREFLDTNIGAGAAK